MRPWIPIVLYIITTLGFLTAVSFWKVEVFQGEQAHVTLPVVHEDAIIDNDRPF